MVSQAEIRALAFSSDADQRKKAVKILKEGFGTLTNKGTAWQNLIKLSHDEELNVRLRAAEALGVVFGQVPSKDQAWEDLHQLAQDEDSDVQWVAAVALGSAFSLIPDKDRAWKDLIKIVLYNDLQPPLERGIDILEAVFNLIPDRDHAWKDLRKLTQDGNPFVRNRAVKAIRRIFRQIPEKDQAWMDLNEISRDQFFFVGLGAAAALRAVFIDVPDKNQAWMDLHELAQDQDIYMRWKAVAILEMVFSQVPDKYKAWLDLNRLTQDEAKEVRSRAAGALGLVFGQVPNYDQAWEDMHRLAQDDESEVRQSAAEALGFVFGQVPNKDQAWEDLERLAQDEECDVRCISLHSMGRISIWKAAEPDGNLKTHLEKAIEFFKRSSEEFHYCNPAKFCLPFYQSLHCLLFTDVSKEDEVQKYLAEAKEAIEASESKEVLLEAVNNLSKALQEVRAYSVDDIVLRRRDLRSYTKYCLQTAECLREARSKAPLASKVVDYTLVEKSIPILGQKIKALFRDVQATAGELCKSTKGTDLEAFGRDVYESTRGLNKVESWIAADRYLEEIGPLLKGHCNRLPREAQAYLKTLVDSQDTASLEQRFNTLKSVLLASLIQGENDDRLVKEQRELFDLHLKNIEFAILNLNTSSGNARKDLYNLKNQIYGLQKEIESQGLAKKELAEALDEKDQAMIDRLERMNEKMLQAVRETTQLNASKRDIETILKELDDQDSLKKRDALGIIADLSSLAGMALGLLL